MPRPIKEKTSSSKDSPVYVSAAAHSFEIKLWQADKLRINMDAAEYKLRDWACDTLSWRSAPPQHSRYSYLRLTRTSRKPALKGEPRE